jgi:hypothetical protein
MALVNVGLSVDDLEVRIKQTGERVVKHGIDAMRDEANKIADLAKEYAPHDEGRLEEAIKVEETKGERIGGKFTRAELSVYVDGDMQGSGNMKVGEYAYLMHEGLGPYGDYTYNLGKGSREKDGGRGVVGGKFLERAADERRPSLIKRLDGMFRRFFK